MTIAGWILMVGSLCFVWGLAGWCYWRIFGSIRVSQRHFGAFRGFAWVIRWESPCGSSWKTRSVFQGAVGAFGASTVPSASTGPVRVRQDDSQGGGGPPRPRTAVDR